MSDNQSIASPLGLSTPDIWYTSTKAVVNQKHKRKNRENPSLSKLNVELEFISFSARDAEKEK
jgi:hypothetical protein